MKLLIDNREPQSIIKYITALNNSAKQKFEIEIKTLDIGDYIIENNNKNIIIIERKSLQDLEASIKDGRYNEQSYRLNENPIHNHNIIYLIEGNIINYKNLKFKTTLYSSIVSLNFFKGFSVLNSVNEIETGEIIYNFINKLLREKKREGFYNNVSNNISDISNTISNISNTISDISNNENITPINTYTQNLKTAKKSYITCDNIMEIMLNQIPGISNQTSCTISKQFKSMENLILNLKQNENCLDSLKLENSNRKISKKCIENIKKFILI